MIPKKPKIDLPEEVPGLIILYWRTVLKRHGLTLPHLCLLQGIMVGINGKDLLPEKLKERSVNVLNSVIEFNPKKLAAKYKIPWQWNWKGCEWARCQGIQETVIGYSGVNSEKPKEWLIESYDWKNSSKQDGIWLGQTIQHRSFAKTILSWITQIRSYQAK